jgi:carboxypeptidase C (cathepsin A)
MTNPLYLTGESYGGHYVPCFAYALLNNANLTDLFTTIPFKEVFRGIAVGDGLANMEYQEQYFDTFYYSIGLASESIRKTLYQRELNGQNLF